MDFWKDAFVPVVAAAIGTGVGATVAFFIERGKKAREIEDEHVTATNTALFVLFKIFNDLAGYKRQCVTPHLNDPERWYTLPPTKLPAPPKFDLATLAYLFEVPGDAPSLPMAVHVGIGMYESVYEAATERYRMHLHEAQPALELAQRRIEGDYPMKHLVNTVLGGPRVTESMQAATDQLIELIDLTLDYIPKHGAWLRDVAKAKYPKRQIVRLEIRQT
jgi:hypothetical protein